MTAIMRGEHNVSIGSGLRSVVLVFRVAVNHGEVVGIEPSRDRLSKCSSQRCECHYICEYMCLKCIDRVVQSGHANVKAESR